MGLRSGKVQTRFKAWVSQLRSGTRIKKSRIPQDVPLSSLCVAKIVSSTTFYQLFLRACPKCDTFLDRKFIQNFTVWVVEKPSATYSFCLHLLTVLLCTSACVQIFFTCLCLYIFMCF